MMPKNGGVVHVNFIGAFVSPKNADFEAKRKAAVRDLHMRLDTRQGGRGRSGGMGEGESGAARDGVGCCGPH